MTIVTRFAPSPTGYLHIWSLRTVLYNYLFTRKNNWKFLLRIEDTDRARYVEWSIENMINILTKLWLEPDESIKKPWNVWPYLQSERLDIYQKYIKILLEKDLAYYCFCSGEKLEETRKQQEELWLATKYDWTCKYLTKEEVKKNLDAWIPYTIRLKVPANKEIVFDDMIKWKIKFDSKEIDDQILIKSDWFPTYHFAVVVDDYLMKVTHIIRWDEWIPSTPKHILLFEAFGWEVPKIAHVPPLIWADKKKLSKRTWDVSVEKYLEKWYLVEALLNYLALLWWNPKTTEEFFTMDELIKKFDIEQVHKAGAFFDVERLDFFNSHYLKNINLDELYEKLLKYLAEYNQNFLEKISKFSPEYNKKILNELKTRIKKFDELEIFTNFFYEDSKIPSLDLILNPKMKIENLEDVKKSLNLALEILELKVWNFENLEELKNIFVEKIKEAWMKNWQVLWPIRCTLSWEEFSPWAFEMIYILWNGESIKRIKKVLENLK